MRCGANGVVSLLACVAGSSLNPMVAPVPALDSGEVLAHVTACRHHSRMVRRWLAANVTRPDAVWTVGTEALMRGWGQIVDPISLPVVKVTDVRAASA